MSNFTSDEEIGDELEIKPPQAQVATRDRRRDRGDRYKRPKNKDYRREEDRSRSRRRNEFEAQQQQQQQQQPRGRHHYPGVVERERIHGRRGDREGGVGSSRPSRKHDKYAGEPKPGREGRGSDDPRRQLKEHTEKRIHMQQATDRFFNEVKRKRDMERDEVKLHDDKKASMKSRSPSPALAKSDEDDHDLKSKSDKYKDSNSSSHLFPEVEDIEESSSDLEEGEQTSPIQSHSDVSASENEEESNLRKRDHDDNERSPVSVASDSPSSSPSHSDSNSKDSSSKSSDSENEEEHRNGASDKGESASKSYKLDSPGSPDNRKESNAASPSTEEVESDTAKSQQGASEVMEIDEATDILNLLPPYYPAIQGCRRVEEFNLLNRIEEGTYGVVYRAKDKRTNEIVALKKLKMEKEKDGFPITSLREINTLLKAQHENIVTVREIVVGSNTDKIFLVMDYVEHDLKSLMETVRQKERGYGFGIGEVKCLMMQLLAAVAHLHDNWILHRDLKTSNLLLSHKGILKVGDFGLAREYGSPLKQYTPIVVTLWYRAPELLLGMREYSTPIDVWSVGCIFGELLKMEPMFPGKSEANQLNLIFQTLGTPNDKIWPGYSQLPVLQRMTFADYPVNKLKTRFPTLSESGIDLMNKFLTFNPAKRITAEEALKHKFFAESPLPISPSMFPTYPAKSELGHRKAATASPKPPSGGRQFKDLRDEDSDATGFFLGMGDRRPPIGPGFNLKF